MIAIHIILILLLYMNIGCITADRLFPDSDDNQYLMQVGFWPVALIVEVLLNWNRSRKKKPCYKKDEDDDGANS